MPTLRYEIRSELGLGSAELYRAASRDGPEAVLEGVAVAGLVGVLKQLGDLAEFASEIFHDLHKEVMATATRGNGLVRRVQQIEAEFSLMQNAFLSRNTQTRLDDMGVIWHAKLQMDQNLITGEKMPQFMTDSYEECRSPPGFSFLDKYDVSGAGACLRRYSDPSFFKTKLDSTGIVQSKVERERRVEGTMKKGPCWRNDETDEIFSAPRFNKLQDITSKLSSGELSATRVKLKSTHVPGSNTKSYMECLCEILSPEDNCVSRNSKRCSSESVSEVHEGYMSNKSLGPQDMDWKECSSDVDCRTEESACGYSSDGLASDVGNYMDALNTMESEVETDSENNVKPNQQFTTVTKGTDSVTDDELELNCDVEIDSFSCAAEATPISPTYVYSEESFSRSNTDLTSSIKHSSPNGGSITENLNGMHSFLVDTTNGVEKDSDFKLPCSSVNSTICSQNLNDQMSRKSFSEESGFCVLQEEHIPDDLGIDHIDSEVVEKSALKTNRTDEVEAQLISDLDSSDDPSGAKLSNEVCHTIPSELAQIDLHPNNIEEDCIDPYRIEKDIGSTTSLCDHQESSREVVESFEDARKLQCENTPNIISFERYFSLKNNENQINHLDTMGNLLHSTWEPDSDVSAKSITFTEFLKLAQMDFLLKSEKDFGSKEDLPLSPHFVTESPEEVSKAQASSEYNSVSSRQQLCQLDLISPITNIEELPPLPPLPPLEWITSKSQMGNPISQLKTAQSSIGQNLIKPLSTIERKPSSGLLTMRGENIRQSNPVPSVGFEEMSINLSNTTPYIRDNDHLNPFLSSEEFSKHSFQVSVPTSKNARSQLDQLLSSSELKRSEHSSQFLEKETVESEGHQIEYKLPDYLTAQMLDDEKLEIPHALLRPRDPLIEAVASYDKCMLRKIPERIQSSIQLKTDENGTMSHNLKPITGVKFSMRFPTTILNATILEKANAIRQACIGSDDEDDIIDSWSDS